MKNIIFLLCLLSFNANAQITFQSPRTSAEINEGILSDVNTIKSKLKSSDFEKSNFLVGMGREDITLYDEDDYGTFGWAFYGNLRSLDLPSTRKGIASPCYSRAFVIYNQDLNIEPFIFVNLDLGSISQAIVDKTLYYIRRIRPNFKEENLMITATHTHSNVGHFSHYAYIMLPNAGHKDEVIDYLGLKIFKSIEKALAKPIARTIEVYERELPREYKVGVNRSILAYNLNEDIPKKLNKYDADLALNRSIPILAFRNNDTGEIDGYMNIFGLHPIASDLTTASGKKSPISSDINGFSSLLTEKVIFNDDEYHVAIMAQRGAGDINPRGIIAKGDYTEYKDPENQDMKNYLSPVDNLYHKKNYKNEICESNELAKDVGFLLQNNSIITLTKTKPILIVKENDNNAILSYKIWKDFGNITVDKEFAHHKYNRTSPPSFGPNFFTGTNNQNEPKKGNIFSRTLKLELGIIYSIRRSLYKFPKILPFKFTKDIYYFLLNKESLDYWEQLDLSTNNRLNIVEGGNGFRQKIAGMDPKAPLFKWVLNIPISLIGNFFEEGKLVQEWRDAAKKNALDEHTILPQTIPLQLTKIGNIALVGYPGEITQISAKRLENSLLSQLKSSGIERVYLISYANEYTFYCTTHEEYKYQNYEGNSTIFGINQLGAFQTEFKNLAKSIIDPSIIPSTKIKDVFSKDELDKRKFTGWIK